MNKKISLNHLLFSLPILLLLFLVLLSQTSSFQTAPSELSIGILLDLIITIPLVYYLLIRKTKIPRFTIIYPFLIGIVVAGFILPREHQSLLSTIKYFAIPVIEFGVLSMIIYKMISLKKTLNKTEGADFYDRVLIACHEVFPNRIGKILATEIAVIYYFWALPKKTEKRNFEFTGYKKSGIRTTVSVLLFMLVAETAVVHLLVAQWSHTVAWVLSLIGIYTIIQIIAILRSMSQRFISIDQENECIQLKYGFGAQTRIPFNDIESIEQTRKSVNEEKGHVALSLFDLLDTHNIIIKLRNENTLHKVYGMKKKYTSIAVFVDEVDLFVNEFNLPKPENL